MLARLEERVSRRLPAWNRCGPEDPAVVLLEAFAEALAEVEAEAEGVEERLFPRVLESFGEEPRWAVGASGAVVFRVAGDDPEPVWIPRGTRVGTRRVAGEARLSFETTVGGWASSGKLARVMSLAGEEPRSVLSETGAPTFVPASPVPLFGGRDEIARYLYLGDPVLALLRESDGALVLEWPGHPSAVAEGRWDYSVAGGWRHAQVECEEVRSEGGHKRLRWTLHGPLSGLSNRELEGVTGPWLRLCLPVARRLTLSQPQWTAMRLERGGLAPTHESAKTGFGFVVSMPRPVTHLLSFGGERWEEHSFSRDKIKPALSSPTWDPALYLGWESPLSASVYFALTSGGGSANDSNAPELLWEYSKARRFQALEVTDGTLAFTRDGTLSWKAPGDWEAQELFGQRLFWVRSRWVDGAYVRPPAVRAVLPHAVDVRQGQTLESHVVEVTLDSSGSGHVDLSFPEGEPAPIREVAARMEGGEWTTVREASVRRLPEGGYHVELGARFSGSVQLKFPELRVGLGAHGNVATGSLRVLESDLERIVDVAQPLPLGGARDAETADAFRGRIIAEWKTGDRAVTEDDFRRLCQSYDPSLARVEVKRDAARGERLVVTVISPDDFCPRRARDLEEMLLPRVPVGMRLEVVAPVALPVEVQARPRADAPDARAPSLEVVRFLEEALRRYTDPLSGGPEGQGFADDRWWDPDTADARLVSIFLRFLSGSPFGVDWSPREWRYGWAAVGTEVPVARQAILAERTTLVLPSVATVSFRGDA